MVLSRLPLQIPADPAIGGQVPSGGLVREGEAIVRGMADANPDLSLVIATLNERRNLPELFARIRAQPLPGFELIVVDDGSSDGTREYVRAASTEDPRVRLLCHEGKQTTLRAHSQGIEASRGRWVIVLDADLQHPPEALPSMISCLREGAALVVASRYAPDGSPGRRTPSRWAISRVAEWLAKLALPSARRVTDPVSGYFGFRRDLWQTLPPRARGYKLLLFVLAMAGDLEIREVGFRFASRSEGTSKVTEDFGFVRLYLAELRQARSMARIHRSGTRP